jgi:hypothetical protein
MTFCAQKSTCFTASRVRLKPEVSVSFFSFVWSNGILAKGLLRISTKNLWSFMNAHASLSSLWRGGTLVHISMEGSVHDTAFLQYSFQSLRYRLS